MNSTPVAGTTPIECGKSFQSSIGDALTGFYALMIGLWLARATIEMALWDWYVSMPS